MNGDDCGLLIVGGLIGAILALILIVNIIDSPHDIKQSLVDEGLLQWEANPETGELKLIPVAKGAADAEHE